MQEAVVVDPDQSGQVSPQCLLITRFLLAEKTCLHVN